MVNSVFILKATKSTELSDGKEQWPRQCVTRRSRRGQIQKRCAKCERVRERGSDAKHTQTTQRFRNLMSKGSRRNTQMMAIFELFCWSTHLFAEMDDKAKKKHTHTPRTAGSQTSRKKRNVNVKKGQNCACVNTTKAVPEFKKQAEKAFEIVIVFTRKKIDCQLVRNQTQMCLCEDKKDQKAIRSEEEGRDEI